MKVYKFLAFTLLTIIAGVRAQEEELQDLEGYITSPGYPSEENPEGAYPSNADYLWYKKGNSTTMVQFMIWDIGIEAGEGDSNITCDFDYINVTISSIGSKRFCGHYNPEEELRGMGDFSVHLVSDDSVEYRGFVASYRIIPYYNPCDPSPCGNGKCDLVDLLPKCTCDPGVTGEQCTIDIDECESSPCLNNGTCDQTKAFDSYECQCTDYYEGDHCETEREIPPTLKCYQCGNSEEIPCGDEESPDNLKECPTFTKFCTFFNATHEGNSHIRRDCSETEVEDCDDFKNELQLPEEANCTFNSCEEEGCNGCSRTIITANILFIATVVVAFLFFDF